MSEQEFLEYHLKKIGLEAGKPSKNYPEDKNWDKGCTNSKIKIGGYDA